MVRVLAQNDVGYVVTSAIHAKATPEVSVEPARRTRRPGAEVAASMTPFVKSSSPASINTSAM